MRCKMKIFGVVLLLFNHILSGTSQESFEVQHIEDCHLTQFFSTTTYQCTECGKFQVHSKDGLECVCEPGYWQTYESVSGQLSCVGCPPEHVTSKDGLDCIRCESPLAYDATTKTCTPCPNGTVQVELTPNGTRRARGCLRCGAEAEPAADGSAQCHRCDRSLLAASGSCRCPDSHLLLSGVCLSSSQLNQVPAEASMYTIDFEDGTTIDSAFFRRHSRAAAFLCRFRHNISACHLLANLCAITMYSERSAAAPCGQLRQLASGRQRPPAPHLPWLFYEEDEAPTVLSRSRISQEYTVQRDLQSSYLNLTVARFSADGRLLGRTPLDSVRSSVCPQLSAALRSATRFGSRFEHTCTLSGRDLLEAGPPEFFELYLQYHADEVEWLYAIPVRVLNYRRNGRYVNQAEDRHRWQLVHRFFLVDAVSSVPSAGTGEQPGPQLVQYVRDVHLQVEMRSEAGRPGRIAPPLLTLGYGLVPAERAAAGGLPVRVRVSYSVDMSDAREQIEVAVGVMSAFAVVWAIFRTWAWSSRNGKTEVDVPTLIHLLVCCCGSLANVFLLVMFCTCFYWFIFFKRQEVAYSLLPTPEQERFVRDIVISAFVLKTADVIWLLWRQVTVSLFLLDWERPKARSSLPHPHLPAGADGSGTGTDSSILSQPVFCTEYGGTQPVQVSIWRTYFIANEWNELQTQRRINQTWQLMMVLFALEIIGFIDLGSAEPDSGMSLEPGQPAAPQSFVCRFSVIVLTYGTVTALQWMFNGLLYERFVENKMQQFVDLCSISNISLFILYERNYGYYIHGRSVHGHADADLSGLYEQLQREQEDLCSRRGLVPGADQQTFQLMLPNTFRLHYDDLLAPMQRKSGGHPAQRPSGGAGDSSSGPPAEQHPSIQAYNTINRFLAAFIEHAIKELDYTVKDKKFIESMMDIEFADPDEKGVFYNDGRLTFERALLYGHGWALAVFDVLLFCFVDLLSGSTLLAGMVVFVTGKMVDAARYYLGRRNLAKKTLVDERFLI
ncbi:meckelin-like isoform X2 [Amphibalanus amphitrite]|uniref:meckelin-like isoform X2 n=1 Tax=Amphibalanus amphitrite TaxID=1232801 RepID=UPI001C912B0C|nr:meckelin-like isoform X2 [Amphibalanus amphitrite]